MIDAKKVQIQCPNCGTPFETKVESIIDVGQNPALRQALLSGQLNLAVCPNCRQVTMLEVPLLYHDPEAEFLAVYMPPQVNAPEAERQKMIGEMTQALMRALPPEQRKGYFFNPRQFINRQNLLDAVLGTMGIGQEELDRQRRKVKLLEQAMVMVDDPKGLQMLAKAQDAEMDYEFFTLLSGMHEQAASAGDKAAAGRLATLRERLLPVTTFGKRAAKQEAAIASLKDLKSPDELLDRILAMDFEEAEAIAVVARQLFDYTFFERLTERVEASKGAERDRLTKLRERLLQVTQQLDEIAKATFNSATELLKEMVTSPNPRSAVRAHMDEIDDTFMAVLSMNLQEAERQGSKDALQRMQLIWDEVTSIIEEQYPPDLRLISELLSTPYPEGTRNMLKSRKAELTPEVLTLMDHVADELAQREDQEAAKRLRDIKAQAALLV